MPNSKKDKHITKETIMRAKYIAFIMVFGAFGPILFTLMENKLNMPYDEKISICQLCFFVYNMFIAIVMIVSVKKRFIKTTIISILAIIIILPTLFIFAHSTPERCVQTKLIFNGYLIDGFRCKIVKSNSPADKPRARSLQAINPRIGFDDYECDKGFLGLWFVYDWGNC